MDTTRLLTILAAIAVLALLAFYFVGPGEAPIEATAPAATPAADAPEPGAAPAEADPAPADNP